jgi:hypothetical protein
MKHKSVFNKTKHCMLGLAKKAFVVAAVAGFITGLQAKSQHKDPMGTGGYVGLMGGGGLLSTTLAITETAIATKKTKQIVILPWVQDKGIKKWQGSVGLYGGYLGSLGKPYVLGGEGYAAFCPFSETTTEPGTDPDDVPGSVKVSQSFSGGLLIRGGMIEGPWLFTLKAGGSIASFNVKGEFSDPKRPDKGFSESKVQVGPSIGFDVEHTFKMGGGSECRVGFGHLSTFYPKVRIVKSPRDNFFLEPRLKSSYNAQFVVRVGFSL